MFKAVNPIVLLVSLRSPPSIVRLVVEWLGSPLVLYREMKVILSDTGGGGEGSRGRGTSGTSVWLGRRSLRVVAVVARSRSVHMCELMK